MDLVTPLIDLLSVAVLVFLVLVGSKAVRAFKQSKQAVIESASLLEIIVNALTTRVSSSESVVSDLQHDFERINDKNTELEHEQSKLRGSYRQVLEHLQETLSNDKRLLLELEQLKVRLGTIQERQPLTENVEKPAATPTPTNRLPASPRNALAALTPTERHTLEILSREGPKAAPELGRRMRKSREHMARLMKKLYLEGYVDRESNHAPFRYKLSEKIATLLDRDKGSVTEEALEKV